MRVLEFPVRIAGEQLATVEQGSPQEAAQVAQAVVSTVLRERLLAPDFGIMDPVGVGVHASEVVAAMAICEPDLVVLDVEVSGPVDSRQSVSVSVEWGDDSGV